LHGGKKVDTTRAEFTRNSKLVKISAIKFSFSVSRRLPFGALFKKLVEALVSEGDKTGTDGEISDSFVRHSLVFNEIQASQMLLRDGLILFQEAASRKFSFQANILFLNSLTTR